MADNYALPPRIRVINLINEANPGANLTLQKVTLGPVSVSTINNRNSTLTITAIPGSMILGNRQVWYNRLEMDQYFEFQRVLIEVDDPQTSYDLLPPLLQQYNTYIDEDDVQLLAVNGDTHTLISKPDSYGWLGQLDIDIIPVQIPLETVLLQTTITTPLEGDIYITSIKQFMDAVNAANGSTVPLSAVTLTLPQVNITVPGANTRVRISAIPNMGYRGYVDIYYNRLDILNYYSDPVEMNGVYEEAATGTALRLLLEVRNNTKFTAGEVINAPVTTGVRDIYLTLSNQSYVWIPNSLLGVRTPKLPLSLGYSIDALNGFASGDLYASALEQLLVIANATNNKTFTVADIALTDITPIPLEDQDGSGRNTTVTATAAVNNATYTGSVSLTYTRISVETTYPDAFEMPGVEFTFNNTIDILAQLVNRLQFVLPNQYVVNDPVSTYPVTMTIAAAHPIWLPGSTFSVTRDDTPVDPDADVGGLLLDGGGSYLLDGGGQLILDDVAP